MPGALRPRPPSFPLAKMKTVSPAAISLPPYIVLYALKVKILARGSSTSALIANIMAQPALVPEIVELQGHADVGPAQKGDGFLQIVALFAGNPDLVALDLRLNFQLRVLDQPRDLPSGLGIDAVFQNHQLLGSGEIALRIFDVQTTDIDSPLGNAQLQDFQHLLQLEIRRRGHGDGGLFELEAGSGVLEIEALRQFAHRLIDRIRQLVRIDFRHHIERGHALAPRFPPAAGPGWFSLRSRIERNDRRWRDRCTRYESCGH